MKCSYKNIKIIVATIVALLPYALMGANIDRKEPAPSWLDTRPPQVRIEPRQKMHRSVFHVSFFTDEPAAVYFSRESVKQMHRYRRPISITRDGIYRFYYYAEDDFGNRSDLDSFVYVLDSKPPELKIIPASGTYRKNTIIRIISDGPCKYYLTADKRDTLGEPVSDSFPLIKNLSGYLIAVDEAGNKRRSDFVEYRLDTSRLSITISPDGGIYRTPPLISFTVSPGAEAFYSFDPLAPTEWFGKYQEPVRLPHGLTIVRFFARSPSGIASPVNKVSYIVDTVAPKLYMEVKRGQTADTLVMYCKEEAIIRYTSDGKVPTESSPRYNAPLTIPHAGIKRIKAKAWDRAGNISEIYSWEYKYDHTPPVVSANPHGGIYRKSVEVTLTADEPAKILYTLNGSPVGQSARIYSPGSLVISREGITELRYRGIDSSGNISEEKTEKYIIDSRPPEVSARIETDQSNGQFSVSLLCKEPATIYYAVNEEVTSASSVYREPILIKGGDVLRFFGVDSLGNTGKITVIDDIRKLLIEATPGPGVYNRKLKIGFERRTEGRIWCRLSPDTLFRTGIDTITLDKEGLHTLEYFLETPDGKRGIIRRNEYFLDWTPPRVTVRIKRGNADSVIVFFEADENASFYYTSDGTNPLFSAAVKTAGNKLQRSQGRIVLKRDPKTPLAWYAEDAAGNQSALTVTDVSNPRVVPDIPEGTDRIYDRILSINLQSQEGAVIHYERHGRKPGMNSPIFKEPIILTSSDTIVAFAIDASGFSGTPEAFIYLIDLPPLPQFIFTPDTVYAGSIVVFDATATLDRETIPEKLKFRWDFEGDKVFDTDSGYFPKVSHIFKKARKYRTALEVTDGGGRKAVFEKVVPVKERCPPDMVASFDSKGNAFCIDRYEWPNRKGVVPLVNVSWVEAKMFCMDAGKRLCRYDEWISACNNDSKSKYPYGDDYDRERCATNEKSVIKSGSKERCVSAGIADMIGNAWEWIEDRNGDYVQALGGSFRYDREADCALKSEGTVSTRSDETGFRCCK